MKKYDANKRGFTLIELLVVVLIIGILASVALPQYNLTVERSRASEALMLLRQIAAANEVYQLENGDYALTLNDLDIEIPGKEDTYNSRARTTTTYFAYDVRHTDGTAALALAQRLPHGEEYYLFINPGETKIWCGEMDGTSFKGICKKLGGEAKDGMWYIE